MKEVDERIKKLVAKWLEQLDEQEKAQVELLDAYFTYRRNLPEDDPGFGKATKEPKTTEEIVDDLAPMMYLSSKIVVNYLRIHAYGFTTLQDGSVKWAIWRYMGMTAVTE